MAMSKQNGTAVNLNPSFRHTHTLSYVGRLVSV